MDIEDLKNKTLDGIDECQEKINYQENLIKEGLNTKYRNLAKETIKYWTGYQDCLKALDLHLKMENIKEWANKECKNECITSNSKTV